MNETLRAVVAAGQDFEWYPTTETMIMKVAGRLPVTFRSLMDIGAGDGRVLMALALKSEKDPDLFAIEKSQILIQAQPERITPVGVDFHEQNLSALQVDYIFSNPPYSEFELWAVRIIETGYAEKAWLVLPQRWVESGEIAAALAKRGATARVIHSDDFLDAERRARAVVDIVEIAYPKEGSWGSPVIDPFEQWFDQNVFTFEAEPEPGKDPVELHLAKLRQLKTISELVEAYDEDYARMQDNYRVVFGLDYAILKELGVSKDNVRAGIKKRMAGLKAQYWQLLFEHLDAITDRLSTATKAKFLERLNGRASVAFTYDNAYAIVMWAIRHANKYFEAQAVDLFKALATFEGVSNYKSNTRTWDKRGWRYNSEEFDHFALDYRIVVEKYQAIFKDGNFDSYRFPGKLHDNCHELIDDMIAVFSNLGFTMTTKVPSRVRQWHSNSWQDFLLPDGRVLFQAKGFMNGNLHFRIMPEAVKALNVEAGRLLGWLHSPDDVEYELGYSREEARTLFGSTRQITASVVRLLES